MITKEYSKDLGGRNTFGMKVTCRVFMEYDSITDLLDMDFEEMHKPVKHIGGGSNLLFTQDFPGTILHSAVKFTEVLEETDDRLLVSVGAGVVFDDFCSWAAGRGLWGPENLSHIPGEVGAAAVQNIGAYGVEVKDIIRTVYAYDTVEEEFVHFDVSECGYAYRDSVFKKETARDRYIVTHVVFELSKPACPRLDYGHIREAVEAAAVVGAITPSLVRDTVTAVRRTKLPEPAETGSAGSFFKNPVVSREVYDNVVKIASEITGPDTVVPHFDVEGGVKIPAAWLIDQCGWKGRRSGNAAVWDKQPLVIVNATGRALPEEIVALEQKITASVRQRFGITLSPEVEHL